MLKGWQGAKRLSAALLISTALVTAAHAADGIPWPAPGAERGQFTKTVYEEDVKTVLGDILEKVGVQATFDPGVEGTVTFEFKQMPLKGAFNMVVTQNELTASYNPDADVVHITPAAETTETLVPLVHTSGARVRRAAARLGLGGTIQVDDDTGMAVIRGNSDQVKKLEQLVERMEGAVRERNTAATANQEAEAAQQQAMAARHEAQAAREQAALQRRLLDQYMNQDVEVFPLSYANVGATQKRFMGRSVNIPGIEETLKNLIGGYGGDSDAMPEAVQEALPAEYVLSRPRITTDQRTNSVIVRGTPEAIAQVGGIIEKLDQPLPLIDVEVLVVQASQTALEQLGITWGGQLVDAGNNNNMAGALQSNSGAPAADATGLDALSLVPGGDLGASFIYSGSQNVLRAQLNAQSNRNQVQTIASPHVVTLDGVAGSITDQTTQYVQTNTTEGGTGQLQAIEGGLTLNITPSLLPNEEAGAKEMLRLSVAAENTVVNNQQKNGQEMQTEVLIPAGETFIMGGLQNDTRRELRNGIPLLKDIPGLGALFRSDRSDHILNETVFFITPRVVSREELFAGDVAAGRYLERQQRALNAVQTRLQTSSQLLPDRLLTLQEDE